MDIDMPGTIEAIICVWTLICWDIPTLLTTPYEEEGKG